MKVFTSWRGLRAEYKLHGACSACAELEQPYCIHSCSACREKGKAASDECRWIKDWIARTKNAARCMQCELCKRDKKQCPTYCGGSACRVCIFFGMGKECIALKKYQKEKGQLPVRGKGKGNGKGKGEGKGEEAERIVSPLPSSSSTLTLASTSSSSSSSSSTPYGEMPFHTSTYQSESLDHIHSTTYHASQGSTSVPAFGPILDLLDLFCSKTLPHDDISQEESEESILLTLSNSLSRELSLLSESSDTDSEGNLSDFQNYTSEDSQEIPSGYSAGYSTGYDALQLRTPVAEPTAVAATTTTTEPSAPDAEGASDSEDVSDDDGIDSASDDEPPAKQNERKSTILQKSEIVSCTELPSQSTRVLLTPFVKHRAVLSPIPLVIETFLPDNNRKVASEPMVLDTRQDSIHSSKTAINLRKLALKGIHCDYYPYNTYPYQTDFRSKRLSSSDDENDDSYIEKLRSIKRKCDDDIDFTLNYWKGTSNSCEKSQSPLPRAISSETIPCPIPVPIQAQEARPETSCTRTLSSMEAIDIADAPEQDDTASRADADPVSGTDGDDGERGSPSSPEEGIFSGYGFILDTSDQSDTATEIERLNGTVMTKITGSSIDDMKGIFILSEGPRRCGVYLQAVAFASERIVCAKTSWISECVRQNDLVDFRPYLLPAGTDLDDKMHAM